MTRKDQTEFFLPDTSIPTQLGQSGGRNGLFDLVQNMPPPGPRVEEDCQALCKVNPDFLPQAQDGLMECLPVSQTLFWATGTEQPHEGYLHAVSRILFHFSVMNRL